jgi:hypothetical protein
LSRLTSWLCSDPLTIRDGNLACYDQVEIVILSIGLAMRDLWINQYSETRDNLPAHVFNSPFKFREYEQLSHHVDDLLKGFEEL